MWLQLLVKRQDRSVFSRKIVLYVIINAVVDRNISTDIVLTISNTKNIKTLIVKVLFEFYIYITFPGFENQIILLWIPWQSVFKIIFST